MTPIREAYQWRYAFLFFFAQMVKYVLFWALGVKFSYKFVIRQTKQTLFDFYSLSLQSQTAPPLVWMGRRHICGNGVYLTLVRIGLSNSQLEKSHLLGKHRVTPLWICSDWGHVVVSIHDVPSSTYSAWVSDCSFIR